MSTISLADIYKSARNEASNLNHDYIGVEHLTIALLGTKGSITAYLMDELGIPTSYIIGQIRRKISKGNSAQVFSEINDTPRAMQILKAANDNARRNGRTIEEERDLLLALLDHPDSLPMQAFQALKIDLKALKESAINFKLDTGILQYALLIDVAPGAEGSDLTLEAPVRRILERMFYGYKKIRIEHQLAGGYTRAELYVVTPITFNGTEHARVVVKIARADDVAEEARRYESHIRRTLPPFTARLEEHPTVLEETGFGGLKYTLITGTNQRATNLTDIAQEWSPEQIGTWLRDQLYSTFGDLWWMQGRPSPIELWMEYDWLLPPLMILDYVPTPRPPDDSIRVRPSVKKSQLDLIRYGDQVTVESFNVQKVDRQKRELTLAINGGPGVEKAYRIRFRNVDFDQINFSRSELVDHLTGKLWESRQGQLVQAVNDLIPEDFNVRDEFIPIYPDTTRLVANPLMRYDYYMGIRMTMLISKIHGDMHTGNLMVGPKDMPFLIDFAHARDGHTLFDWACLEISLLNTVVMPRVGDTWKDIRQVIDYLSRINNRGMIPSDNPIGQALIPISDIRHIVASIMIHCNQGIVDWPQYYLALAMCALRAITWDMPVANRRLMLFVAALSFNEIRYASVGPKGKIRDTLPPDEL